jgi:hypothetical protein
MKSRSENYLNICKTSDVSKEAQFTIVYIQALEIYWNCFEICETMLAVIQTK